METSSVIGLQCCCSNNGRAKVLPGQPITRRVVKHAAKLRSEQSSKPTRYLRRCIPMPNDLKRVSLQNPCIRCCGSYLIALMCCISSQVEPVKPPDQSQWFSAITAYQKHHSRGHEGGWRPRDHADHYIDYAGLSEESLSWRLRSMSLTHIHFFANHQHYASLCSKNDSTTTHIGIHHRSLSISA